MRKLSETSNNHALYCMLNHGNTLVQLLHCLSLSSCQLESPLPPAAQLLLSQSQQGDLVDIICDFQTSLREFLDPVVNHCTRHTLSSINRKYFFMNKLCIESFSPHKTHNRTPLFGSILKHGRHFYY
jgi:hypothetical protein